MIKVRAGQVWEFESGAVNGAVNYEKGDRLRILDFDSECGSFEAAPINIVEPSYCYTVTDKFLNECFRFIPQSDLEWLALIGVKIPNGENYAYFSNHIDRRAKFSKHIFKGGKTQQEIQNMRHKLGLDVKPMVDVTIEECGGCAPPVIASASESNPVFTQEKKRLIEDVVNRLHKTIEAAGPNIEIMPTILQAISELEEVAPVFTQSMEKAGELPPIGSKAMYNTASRGDIVGVVTGYRTWKSLNTLADNCDYRVFVTFEHNERLLKDVWPIDNRTEGQKVRDNLSVLVSGYVSAGEECDIQHYVDELMQSFSITLNKG